MTGESMACSQNWLDTNTTGGTLNGGMANGTLTGNTLGQAVTNCWPYWQYQYWPAYYYPVYSSSPARPIKLALSEVERLRKAAKADDKLKAILQKFTDQIEITVDFE